MLVSISPKLSVSQFIGYLKEKSSLMIFDRYAEIKWRYGNRKFWCRGYYVDTVGRNKKQIEDPFTITGIKTNSLKKIKDIQQQQKISN